VRADVAVERHVVDPAQRLLRRGQAVDRDRERAAPRDTEQPRALHLGDGALGLAMVSA
jgi:hypothetical protein